MLKEQTEKLEQYKQIIENYFKKLYSQFSYQHPHFPRSGQIFEAEMYDACLDAIIILDGDWQKFNQCHDVAMKLNMNCGIIDFIQYPDLYFAGDRSFVARNIKTLAHILSKECKIDYLEP